MKAKVYKTLPGKETFELGEELGQIVMVEGTYSVETEDEELKKLLEEMLRKPIKQVRGDTIDEKHVSIVTSIETTDDKFLPALKYELLKKGYWLEIEEGDVSTGEEDKICKKMFELGHKEDKSDFEVPSEQLRKHAVILGGTGSGKTVLGKCIIEEATRCGIPSIVIDPQGDLASLSLMANEQEILNHGGELQAATEWQTKGEVRIFTPASTKGIPISLQCLRLPPKGRLSEEKIIKSLDLIAASILRLCRYNLDEDSGMVARGFLYELLNWCWNNNCTPPNLEAFSELVQHPPATFSKGKTLLEDRAREELAKKIRLLTVGANALLFERGHRIGMDLFLTPIDEKKVPVNVIYLNTLYDDEQKQFFVAMIEREIYTWMLQHPSKELQLLFYVDEVAPYLPPHPRNPPAKEALKLLFKQGRKYGVGCIMSTQNPAEIEYKAMAQASIWTLGRLMAKQDLEKVQHILRSINASDYTHTVFSQQTNMASKHMNHQYISQM